MYQVLSPEGQNVTEVAKQVSYLSELKGKTVCEVSNGYFKSGVTFRLIRKFLQDRGVKVIPYTEFPILYVHDNTAEQLARVDATVSLLKEKGCDAVIVGNGG
ncbi:hypothetical protein ACFLW4_05555 [Chloroflexota bacterium]